jgi:hypothetical protein
MTFLVRSSKNRKKIVDVHLKGEESFRGFFFAAKVIGVDLNFATESFGRCH